MVIGHQSSVISHWWNQTTDIIRVSRQTDNRCDFSPLLLRSPRSEILIQKSVRQPLVVIDAAVAKEWPVSARFVNFCKITVDHQHFFFVGRSSCQDSPEGICHERLSPEIQLAFTSHAIDNHDKKSVGGGLAALDGFPCLMLCVVCLR